MATSRLAQTLGVYMLVIVDLLSIAATLLLGAFTTQWIKRRSRKAAWLYALTLCVAFLIVLMASNLEPPSKIFSLNQFEGPLEVTVALGLWALFWASLGAFYTALDKPA